MTDDTDFPPANDTLVDLRVKQDIINHLTTCTTVRLLNILGPMTEDLILRRYPVEIAYPALVGKPSPLGYDWTALKTDGRSQLLAIGGTFWRRISATVAAWPVQPRLPDGTVQPDDTFCEAILAHFGRIPPIPAIETWLASVAAWLHTCSIDAFLRTQYRHPGLVEVTQAPDTTTQIAWHMCNCIEAFYW